MMRLSGWGLVCCCLALAAAGCNRGQKAPAPNASGLRSEDLVGKWRLVRAGGEPPAALDIKKLELDLSTDGTYAFTTEMEGQWAGMKMKGGGKWSLVDGVVSYSNGANAGKSRARVESGRLILDPDFSVRKGGTQEVVGEYER